MAFVSITRLRIRSLRFLPSFFLHTWRTLAQTRRAHGFVHGALLADRAHAFWTMTVWQDQADMRHYITSGAHRRVMPKLMHWCDEASIVHWTQDGEAMPSWQDADQRMRVDGRASKVRKPSVRHHDLGFPAPRTTGALPINPRLR